MKLEFKVEKKNLIRFLIMAIFSAVMCFAVECPIWMWPVFCAIYFASDNTSVEIPEKWNWPITILLFILSAIVTVFCVQYMLLEPELFVRTSNFKLCMNVLCVSALHFFVFIFSRSARMSCIISHVACLILGFVNYFVYLFRQNEFTFADLQSIGTGLSVASKYHLALDEKSVMAILVAVLWIVFVWHFDFEFEGRVKTALISVTIMAAAITVVAVNTKDVNTETWEKKGSYRNGYILNFVLGIRDSFISEPSGYSKEIVESYEKLYPEKSDAYSKADVDHPTVIVVMSESFADLSVLGELTTNLPLTPYIDSLENNTVKGYALASVFGAKTPNSEWEFMTGNSMAFLPEGSVVYQQYIKDDATSIVSTMKDEGYTCVAMHPYYETGWSRNRIYPNLGFDEQYFIEDFDSTKIIREYITDQELFDKIIERFEDRRVNEDLFIMSISMQNHGGYATPYENFPEKYYKMGRSYTDANQYFSLLHETDEAVKNLITYFEAVDEPVEIVFFGDHQPGLSSGFYEIMNGKGLGGLSNEELQALYTVPFFIWTNYDTPEETVEITSLNYLSTMALERANIPLPPYNQFLADMQEVVPAINSRGYFSNSNQSYLQIEDATGAEEDWIKDYNVLQYNGMFDRKNKSEIIFPYNNEGE